MPWWTSTNPCEALAISGKAGINIEANILWRRARLMRRAWHHRPEWRGLMTRMLQRIAAVYTGRRQPDEDQSASGDNTAPMGPARVAGHCGASLLKKGPFGLLLSSVVRAGGSLSEEGNINFPGETTTDCLREPIQWTRQALTASGAAAAMKRAAARRPSLRRPGRIDFRLSGNLRKALIREQQADLTTIQSGGLWTPNTLYAATTLQRKTWLTCGGHAPPRRPPGAQRWEKINISFTDLPSSLALHGLAPALGNNIRQSFWPTGGVGPQHGARGANAAAQHVPAQAAVEAHLNAAGTERWTIRQLLQHIAGPLRTGGGHTRNSTQRHQVLHRRRTSIRPDRPAAIPAWGASTLSS